MPARLIKIILFSVLLSFSFTKNEVSAAASADKKTEKGDEPSKKKKVRLSQRRFYTLQPFTVPLLTDGEITEQFTIVISLELADEDDRIDIAHSLPRIRNELYNELLHLVTFRRKGERIPQISIFKQLLLKTTQGVTGDKIKSLVVQQAFKAKTP